MKGFTGFCFGCCFMMLPLVVSAGESFDGFWDFSAQGALGYGLSGKGNGIEGGLSLSLERRLIKELSLGLETGFFGTGANGGFFADSLDLMGHVFPFPDKKDNWTPFLAGGAGYRPLYGLGNAWKGEFNAYGGVGVRKPLDSSMSLDLGVNYQFFTPVSSPFQAIEARFGLVWSFGKAKPNSTSQLKPQIKTSTTTTITTTTTLTKTRTKAKTHSQTQMSTPIPVNH